MSTDLHFDHDKQILVVTISGAMTVEEFDSVITSIVQSTEFPHNADTLWDLREADLRRVNAAFWRRVISGLRRYPERQSARVAHVVHGDFAIGMMRMYQILLSLDVAFLEDNMEVFEDYSEAEEWLVEKAHDDGRRA